MNTVTFEAFAYLPKYFDLANVQAGIRLPNFDLTENDEWFAKEGYPMIGKATVTIELYSTDKIVQGQIEALNAQLQNERAASQQRQNAILDQISKLQALTFQGEAA